MSYASLVLGKTWRDCEWPEFVSVSHIMSAEPARRYIRERTGHLEEQYEGFPSHHLTMLGRCSECGERIEVEHNFCFNCGAEVDQ